MVRAARRTTTNTPLGGGHSHKAMVLPQFGDPDQFALRDLPDPHPGSGEVLIRVAASGVNPVDTKIRRGGSAVAPELPAILGMDVAGTVEAVGDGVAGFRPGDAVYGCAGGLRGIPGSLAERMVADARLLAPKPETLSFREAAALPLVTITAWEGLIDRVRTLAGKRVLVYGGTGGVGHVAIQLAKAHGDQSTRVAATASSPEKAAIARDLGADDVVDYRQESTAAFVQRLTGGDGFDVVFDSVGGDNLNHAIEAAAIHGEVVSIVTHQSYDLGPAMAKGLTLHIVLMLLPMLHDRGRAHHGDILRSVSALVATGACAPSSIPTASPWSRSPTPTGYLESGEQSARS